MKFTQIRTITKSLNRSGVPSWGGSSFDAGWIIAARNHDFGHFYSSPQNSRAAALAFMASALTAERFKQLVKAVEAARAGSSDIKTAEDVHKAIMLDAQWAEVSLPQVRRAVSTSNAQHKLSDEEKSARRKQKERERDRRRDRSKRARPAEERAAALALQGREWQAAQRTQRANLQREERSIDRICSVLAAADAVDDVCPICVEDLEVGDELCSLPCALGCTFHRACLAPMLTRIISVNFCPRCRGVLVRCVD